MGDKKERIDHILTQKVTDNQDSAKLNSLLYRDKVAEGEEEKEDNSQNTSMLSFMWGDDTDKKKRKSISKKEPAKAKDIDDQVKPSSHGKTIIREGKDSVEINRDGISLKLGESEEGKLKLKVSVGKRKDISKKRLVKIAMNAIIKELTKEE